MRPGSAVTILLLLGLVNAGAQDTEIEFSFNVDDYSKPRIIESLLDGHRSEVLYEFRLLREAKGISKIFGDRLIREVTLEYVARWDAFDENFVVLIDNVLERAFDDVDSFLAFFLSVENQTIRLADPLHDDDYLLCRWRLQPIKLVPPLTLMTLIKTDLQIISSWQQTTITRVLQ
jgi:hypothetical protein